MGRESSVSVLILDWLVLGAFSGPQLVRGWEESYKSHLGRNSGSDRFVLINYLHSSS